MAVPPGVKFLPNAITVLALCAGLSSVAFAHRATMETGIGWWLLTAGMIGTAAILDSLDGPAARLLNAESRIGAQLDSLSDCVSFGVAPAMVMYLWGLDRQPIGWAFCLLYAVCTALRLARFNSVLDDGPPQPWAKGFFTGIPSPAGALLAIYPMLLDTRFGDGWWTNKWLAGIWLGIVGLLMVSRLPSIALKSVIFPPQLILPALVLLVVAVALAFYQPVIMLGLGLLVYLAHLPYAAWKRRHIRHQPDLWYDNRRRSALRARAHRNARLRPRRVSVRRVAGQRRPRPADPQRPSRPLGRRRLR